MNKKFVTTNLNQLTQNYFFISLLACKQLLAPKPGMHHNIHKGSMAPAALAIALFRLLQLLYNYNKLVSFTFILPKNSSHLSQSLFSSSRLLNLHFTSFL